VEYRGKKASEKTENRAKNALICRLRPLFFKTGAV
jgi:hypothetical protein